MGAGASGCKAFDLVSDADIKAAVESINLWEVRVLGACQTLKLETACPRSDSGPSTSGHFRIASKDAASARLQMCLASWGRVGWVSNCTAVAWGRLPWGVRWIALAAQVHA